MPEEGLKNQGRRGPRYQRLSQLGSRRSTHSPRSAPSPNTIFDPDKIFLCTKTLQRGSTSIFFSVSFWYFLFCLQIGIMAKTSVLTSTELGVKKAKKRLLIQIWMKGIQEFFAFFEESMDLSEKRGIKLLHNNRACICVYFNVTF